MFHIAPQRGWLNDPNGLVERDGRFHVFFQRNPQAAEWAPRLSWGHAVSDDLCSWTYEPDVLVPGEDGPDAGGCWSGCMVDDGGTATAVYSGCAADRDLAESVCLARALDPDLREWCKDPANPVIAGTPPGLTAFRDPFVWREHGTWRMVIGAGLARGDGAVLAYRSDDLIDWREDGMLLSGDGEGLIWECPQYFELGGRRVLLVSVLETEPSHVLAMVGDEVDGRFVPEHVDRFDHGDACYAPATMLDSRGRRLCWAWAREAPGARPSRTAGALTLPRVLTLRRDGTLHVAPADEVLHLATESGDRRHRFVDGDLVELYEDGRATTARRPQSDAASSA